LIYTDPEIAEQLTDEALGFALTRGSGKKVSFTCSNCGTKFMQVVCNAVYTGTACPICSGRYSYPERVMTALLITYCVDFQRQVTFKWSNGKRYDFYAGGAIIETHGMQRYRDLSQYFKNGRIEHDNDIVKRDLAINNSISNYRNAP
jgi:DNA-directed RNA polymerase subunit RPC12/RpoP